MIDQGDIIYFIVTDRFYDGDPSNNNPPGSPVVKDDPRRYHGGDFAGIIEKIPYLLRLGITALWITPVYLGIGSIKSGSRLVDGYHGYWVMDFESVDPRLVPPNAADNGRRALKQLVDILHENGIKVILDIVVNHTGYHTAAYKEYRNKKIPYEWFNFYEDLDSIPEEIKKYKEPLFGLPSLNHDLANVRDYFVNNIVDWIEETGIDALRMDAVPHIERDFWYYFKSYVRGKYRHVFFLGEDLEFDEEAISVYQREHDFDSLFDFPLQRNIIDVLIRDEEHKPPSERRGMTAIAGPRYGRNSRITGVLDADRKYNNPNRLVTLLDNHDMEKRVMTWAIKHAGGDGQEAAGLVKYALTFQFTTRGIPQIYYGTEVGLEGWRDKSGDAMMRQDMPWHKIDPLTLEPFPHCAAERDIYLHLRRLIEIRKNNEAIPYGYLFTLHASFHFYGVMREFRGNTILAVFNNRRGDMDGTLTLIVGANTNIPDRIKDNLANRRILTNLLDEGDRVEYNPRQGTIKVHLQPKEAKIYKLTD